MGVDNFLNDFDSLLSALQAPEGIKPPILKRLYILLVRLTNNPQWSLTCGLNSDQLEMLINREGMVVKFSVICKLSNILFKELSERFEGFFTSVGNASTSKDVRQGGLLLDMGVDTEILLLLLRCCLVILIQCVEQQNLLMEKGQILLVILRKLCSLHLAGREKTKNVRFEKSVCPADMNANNGCTTSMEAIVASLQFLEPSDSLLCFVSAILEVFVDELAVHEKLREYFRVIDSAFSLGENLFVTHLCQGTVGILVEMVSCHFALSFSDEKAIEDSVNRLFWVQEKECKHSLRAPEVSLQAATSLLLNPIVLSTPKCMLAHMVSLVSEACSNTMNVESFKSNPRLVNCFLPIFEKSVNLYHECISTLQIEGLPKSARASFANANMSQRTSQPFFESYISSDRRRKINDLLRMFEDSTQSQLRNIISGTKSEMVNSTIRYVKKSQNVLEISFQDEILSILTNLILKASSGFDDVGVRAIKDVSLQDIYLLSSVLRLMGTSLLSAIFCLKRGNNLSCKEYDFILSTVSCFKEFSINSPIEQQLSDSMKLFSTRHKDLKTMFIHFSGLLSFSFFSGLDCLAKGCLLIINVLVNLFIFEEGNLDALQSLFDCSTESLSSGSALIKVHESVVDHKSSLYIASKFQKLRTLYARPTTQAIRGMRKDGNSQGSGSDSTLCITKDILGMEAETEEATNGQIFLNCVLEKKSIPDFDDLADFIECKPGKNYASWLKDRQKYRNWKCGKLAVLSWKRKKKTWKLIKGRIHELS